MRDFLDELVEASGSVISHYFRTGDYCIEQKSNLTPVTVADQESERVMRELIMKRYPEHGIIGEEFGNHNPDAEFSWVLDPIDGTLSFIHGVPLFVTLIALLHNKQPILGAISQPVMGLTCIGDNQKAWLNGAEISIRTPPALNEATLLTTDLLNIGLWRDKRGFENLLAQVKLFRTWGDGFGYLLLASGKADIMIDAKMAPWDLLPLIPVVRGAGAIITTYDGLDPVTGDSALCAHPILHAQALGILNQNTSYC